jgi:hypothetical protein
MAPIRSIQTPVGWLAMAEPPGSAAALADQIGSIYQVAPANGLSRPPAPPDELPPDELELLLDDELDELLLELDEELLLEPEELLLEEELELLDEEVLLDDEPPPIIP